MHSPQGPKLYHVDSEGKVTVWVYQRLGGGRKDCAEDEVGWGSSQLVDAKGMYYLPDGTPLQSRWSWRNRPGGMTDIRIKVAGPVAKGEHVGLIHRHELPSYFDLYTRNGRERKILFYTFKDEPLSIIVRVDKPMRLGGASTGRNVKRDVQYFDEYDQLLITGPAGYDNVPMLVTVQLPKEAMTGQKADVQVEGWSLSKVELLLNGFYSVGEAEAYSKRLSQIFSKAQTYIEQMSADYGNENWDAVSERAIEVRDMSPL